MVRTKLGIAFCLMGGLLAAQAFAQYPCGTKVSAQTLQDYQAMQQWEAENMKTGHGGEGHTSTELVRIPIKLHVIRHSNGTSDFSASMIDPIFDTLNAFYQYADIRFVQCGPVNYIDDDALVTFESTTEEDLVRGHDEPRVINMYIIDTLEIQGNPVCGWAYLASVTAPNRAFIRTECITLGNTIPHELGHMFSLIHTHGPDTGLTKELVDGSNCKTEGDLVCDTPADPDLTGKTTGSCVYVSTLTDANGDPFDPLLNNIMSYANYNNCDLDSFTPGQYQRVRNSLYYHGRVNLICTETTVSESMLNAVYPNPFENNITIQYQLSEDADVSLAMYDVLGKKIRSIYSGHQEKGLVKRYHTVADTYLDAGMYFIKLEVNGDEMFTKKILRGN